MANLLKLLVFAWLSLCTLSAFGQYTRDTAANEKIREAVDVHFVASDYDKAEGILIGTIKACEDKCKPSTLAAAWMYVGIVRGTGRQNQQTALEAFKTAVELNPNVALDAAFATPETMESFKAAGGHALGGLSDEAPEQPASQSAPVEEPPSTGAEKTEAHRSGQGLSCSPAAITVQTRRPVPVSCRSDGEATHLILRYQPFGSKRWQSLNLRKQGDYFQGQISCESTEFAGPLKYFVIATDVGGDLVDTFGTKREPVQIRIAATTKDPPPAFPGQPPPARCQGEEICPPDFPGCEDGSSQGERGDKDWGSSCRNSTECRIGLLCTEGVCETAPQCELNSDCDGGVCRNGRCDVALSRGSQEPSYQKNFVGLHFAADFGFVGGKDVCRPGSPDYACYFDDGSAYPAPLDSDTAVQAGEPGDPYPGGGISRGITPGTMRVLLSYDRALLRNLTLGGRVGFAFGGGPERDDAPDFLPIHAEARIGYWPGGLSRKPIRSYFHLGGGVAQVDLRTDVEVKDCSTQSPRSAFLDCTQAEGAYDSANQPELPQQNLIAYKKLGQAFVSGGGGVIFALSESLGAEANLNVIFTLPDTGFVVEPSVGGVFIF